MGARLEGPIQHPCRDAELAAGACPDASRVGAATAVTPILGAPLQGPVYLLENPKGGLPRLAILLRGPVSIDLIGDVAINPAGRIVTIVPNVPDVPISSFVLALEGGDHAALSGSGLCSKRQTADVDITAQSGKTLRKQVAAGVWGCAAKRSSAASKRAKAKPRKSKARKKAGRHHSGR
jgi:hypothetical protein